MWPSYAPDGPWALAEGPADEATAPLRVFLAAEAPTWPEAVLAACYGFARAFGEDPQVVWVSHPPQCGPTPVVQCYFGRSAPVRLWPLPAEGERRHHERVQL